MWAGVSTLPFLVIAGALGYVGQTIQGPAPVDATSTPAGVAAQRADRGDADVAGLPRTDYGVVAVTPMAIDAKPATPTRAQAPTRVARISERSANPAPNTPRPVVKRGMPLSPVGENGLGTRPGRTGSLLAAPPSAPARSTGFGGFSQMAASTAGGDRIGPSQPAAFGRFWAGKRRRWRRRRQDSGQGGPERASAGTCTPR